MIDLWSLEGAWYFVEQFLALLCTIRGKITLEMMRSRAVPATILSDLRTDSPTGHMELIYGCALGRFGMACWSVCFLCIA